MSQSAKKSYNYIQQKIGNFKPKHAIVLGSGLGDFTAAMTDVISIPYADIPEFHVCTVSSHSGSLEFGFINKQPIVCLAGRPHYYEGAADAAFLTLIRSLKLVGAENFISISAVGSLRANVIPGEIVLVHDHINFHQRNPLIGINDDEFGPRFIGMDNLYNNTIRSKFLEIGKNKDIQLHDGVYITVLGPVFETPAEIRAYRLLGADVIGMSTVPEVIVAHHCGMTVAVLVFNTALIYSS